MHESPGLISLTCFTNLRGSKLHLHLNIGTSTSTADTVIHVQRPDLLWGVPFSSVFRRPQGVVVLLVPLDLTEPSQ